MFRDDRTGRVFVAALPGQHGGTGCEWITRTDSGHTTVVPFPYGDDPKFPTGVLQVTPAP